MSKSDYIRKLILAETLTGYRWTMDREQAKQLLHEINSIGNSLRLLVYNTNHKDYADHDDWQAVIQNYYDFMCLVAKLTRLREQRIEMWEHDALTMLKKQFIWVFT